MKHELYKDGDSNIPNAIKDRNGEVVLDMCKICGKAEADLSEDCLPKDHKEQTDEMYLSDSETYSIDEIIAHLSKIKESGYNNVYLNIMAHGEAHFYGTDKDSTDLI